MQRARIVVASIAIIVREQGLLVDEHRPSQPEMRVELVIARGKSTCDAREARRDRGSGARPAHGPPLA
jgi:hypothetical protein